MRGFVSFVSGGVVSVGALGLGAFMRTTPVTWLDVSVPETELWDPASGRWTSGGVLAEPVSRGRLERLEDGRILLVDARAPWAGAARLQAWNPTRRAWTFVDEAPPDEAQDLESPSDDHVVLNLPGRRALAVRAARRSRMEIGLRSLRVWARSEGRTWTPTGSLDKLLASPLAAALTGDGLLLVGEEVGALGRASGWVTRAWAPSEGRWREEPAPPWPAREASLVGLSDGRALLVGRDGARGGGAAVWSPGIGWTPTGGLSTPRSAPALLLLEDGRVLAAGGVGRGVARRDPEGVRKRWLISGALAGWSLVAVIAAVRLRPSWFGAMLGAVVLGALGFLMLKGVR